jgi:transcriptional regulator with XRE-family HTH domain
MNAEKIRKIIKLKMASREMTALELANITGIDAGRLSRYFQKKKELSIQNLSKIFACLNITIQ